MQEQVEVPDMRSLQVPASEMQNGMQNLSSQFEYACGSIIGRNHVLASKNNQDALRIVLWDNFVTAVVCDGCGSGKHSEVGAKLGSRMVTDAIADLINQGLAISESDFWDVLKINLLQKLTDFVEIANDAQESGMEFVNNYLLFTIVGLVITPSETVTFSMGDGAIGVNGKLIQIPAYPDNAPPYLAYGLYRSDAIEFEIRDRLPTAEVESILIATDGIDDLIAAEEVNQFWQEDRYFKNPDAIRRKLSMLNREEVKPDWNKRELIKRSGVLSDDTTLVVIRKKR
ncbi:MAG: protein phosphatase [Pseudanabaena sp.]|nr:MAG: protein phosphatase [Pseudanabaena sp.]